MSAVARLMVGGLRYDRVLTPPFAVKDGHHYLISATSSKLEPVFL